MLDVGFEGTPIFQMICFLSFILSLLLINKECVEITLFVELLHKKLFDKMELKKILYYLLENVKMYLYIEY